MFCVYVFHKKKIYFMRKCQQHGLMRQLFQHAHIYTQQKINSLGPNWKDKQNKKSSLDWYFIKYSNTKVLWTCYSISTSTFQRQLIWESYSKADGYVPFMTDLKMVTSKIKSLLTHIKKQIQTTTKLELQAAVLANKMKVIISKSSTKSINKVHFAVQLNIRVAVYQ